MDHTEKYDAVIIGGGPAGVTAALYLLRSGAKVAVVERLATGGQTLMSEMIENYPGFPAGIHGYELADLLAKHIAGYPHDSFSDDVREIVFGDPAEKRLHRVLVGQTWLATRTLVICSGSEYRRLGLPGEKELTGRGVSYCALCDGNFFRDQTVAVIGGGNSALEESLYLAKIVRKLYLIHRRNDFRGARCYQEKCQIHPKIEILRSAVVQRILGANKVEGVVVENLKSGETRTLDDVSGVFVFVGFQPLAAFVPDSLAKDPQGFIITDMEMRTNIPGVFAAGDVRSKLCRQVATAIGDGATAANAAFHYLETHDA